MAKKIVIIVANGTQDEEAYYPYYRLQEEGYEVDLASPDGQFVKGEYGVVIKATKALKDLEVKDYEAVILPGGFRGPDQLRTLDEAKNFVANMNSQGKLIGAICHGVWVAISAKVISNRNATSYHTIKDDLINAGGIYQDKHVVVDGNLITSRRPNDLPNFLPAIINWLKLK